jgi:hypothetical protein
MAAHHCLPRVRMSRKFSVRLAETVGGCHGHRKRPMQDAIMLETFEAVATIAVKDIGVATTFYEQTLGLI